MSDAATKILTDQILSAFQRLRAMIFASMVASAVTLSNLYIEHYSFDEAQYQVMSISLHRIERDERDLYSKLNSQDFYSKEPEREQMVEQWSALAARRNFIENSLKDYKLRTTSLPLIGMSVPSNDLNAITALMLCIFAIWTVFTTRQIIDAITETELKSEVSSLFPALRHAATFIYRPPHAHWKSLISNGALSLPAIATTLALAGDVQSVVNAMGVSKDTVALLLSNITPRICIQLVVSAFLIFAAWDQWSYRRMLTKIFYPPQSKNNQPSRIENVA